MKARFLVGTFAAIFAVTLGMALVGAEGKDEGNDEARVRAGLKFAQAQGINLTYKKKNRDSVGLGAYLVNAAGGCNDCHTNKPYLDPQPDWFLGAPKVVNVPCYLAGGASFGPFTSANITPDIDGKPAGLTYSQFEHALRTGQDPDDANEMLHVMPWPVYQEMTDRDLRAVYDYLSAIPSIASSCVTAP